MEFVIVFLNGGIIILATVRFLHRSVSELESHNPRFNAIGDGTPLVLVRDGCW